MMKHPNIHGIYELMAWSAMVATIMVGVGGALLQALYVI